MAPSILLVNPNRMQPPVTPVGLDYIGQALRESGFEVRLLDLAFCGDAEGAIARALEQEPLLVGVSARNLDDCYYASQDFCLAETKRLLDMIRARTRAPLVVGGVGFSVAPKAAFGFLGCDWGVRGDGEAALVALASCLERGEDPRRIPGLVWREKAGVLANAPEDYDLSAAPPATRDLVDNARYLREGGQVGFETKRGCAGGCVYCADPLAKGRKPRMRQPKAVVEELSRLMRRGVYCFHTCDSEFNAPRDHALAVCEEMRRSGLGSQIQWYAYAEPHGFDAELASAMRRAGCAGVDFGADHASDAMLASFGRKHRAPDLRRVADACRENGLAFMFDLLLGAPGETPASVSMALDLMRDLEPDRVGVSLGVRLYAGTDLVRRALPGGVCMAGDPNLRGATAGNDDMLRPVFYLSSGLGPDPDQLVQDLIAGDPRFLFASRRHALENYNYNDNPVLTNAIRDGYRGAYWDILRRLADEPGETPRS